METDFTFLDDLPKDDPQTESKQPGVSHVAGTKKGLEVGDLTVLPAEEGGSMVVSKSQFKPQIPTDASFDPRLAFEIALGFEKPEVICPRYEITEDEWYNLAASPIFKKAVVKYQEEILEGGISFRLKAKVQAEAYLKDAHLLIKHPLTPPAVKADMIKWMARVADLEPKNAKNEGISFNLQINL